MPIAAVPSASARLSRVDALSPGGARLLSSSVQVHALPGREDSTGGHRKNSGREWPTLRTLISEHAALVTFAAVRRAAFVSG